MKTDIEIQQEIMEAFHSEAALNKAEIGVSVRNGIVALSGQVDAYSKKLTAQQVVWHIKEVRAVALDIKTILPTENVLTDSIIAENILETLRLYSPASTKRIRVRVEAGQAYLEGEIDTADEKATIISAVWYTRNVKDVVDMITINAAANAFSNNDGSEPKKRKIIRREWFVGYEDEMQDRSMASYWIKPLTYAFC